MFYPPTGNNNLNAYGAFVQRKFYHNQAFPSHLPKPIDLLYERPLYGKVDPNNNALLLRQSGLKQLTKEPTEQGALFALDFVADAWRDLVYELKLQVIRKNFTSNSVFVDLTPKRAYESSEEKFQNYMTTLYDVFANSFCAEEQRDNKIKNFETFLPIFINFFTRIAYKFPFTRSNFEKTNFSSYFASGLVVEFLENEDPSNDEDKFNTIILDPNFEKFAREARRFGFFIDKNVPWRLVFDVNGTQTKKFFDPYELSFSNLFSSRYFQAWEVDLSYLKTYLVEFYNSYVNSVPFVKVHSLSKCDQRTTITTTFERKPISLDFLNENYNNAWWIRLYAYLRAIESGVELSKVQFENIVKKAQELEKYKNLRSALSFLNEKFRLDFYPLLSEGGKSVSLGELLSSNKPISFEF